jgi:hypothetical protein
MNWRSGLFRLWVIGTVLFMMAVAMVGYDDIKMAIAYGDIKRDFDAAKDEFTAATSKPGAEQPIAGDWAMSKPIPGTFIDLNDPKQRALDRLNRAEEAMSYAGGARARIEHLASIAVGIPLAVLALGASLAWAFSGFT